MRIFSLFLTLLCLAFVASHTNHAFLLPEESNLNSTHMLELGNLFPMGSNNKEFWKIMRAGHPHANLHVIEIIRLYEYTAEIHTVTTSDGYILELHRIAGNKTNPEPNGKPVVLLQHGLLSSSVDWVLTGPKNGFGFILADAGYDVWLGNTRGNIYSRKHANMTADNYKFWEFDWHEIGKFDLPSMIDYILQTTKREKLFYVGHSQGSTAFFVMASEVPNYNNKISAMFSLAPVAYCSHMYSPFFQTMAKLLYFDPLNNLEYLFGSAEFKPTNLLVEMIANLVCQVNVFPDKLCSNILFLVAGFDEEQFDKSLIPAILAHYPAGASVRQIYHYGQLMNSGLFRQLDYGVIRNFIIYKKLFPPLYNLKNVKAPVSLHYSDNDWLSHPKDVQKLYSELPNPIGNYRVPYDKFNHLDYVWAKDVKTLLYDQIMSIMTRYKD